MPVRYQKRQTSKAHLIEFFMRLQRKFLLCHIFKKRDPTLYLKFSFSLKTFLTRFINFYRNIIDVGALDSHNLEQHEYLERSRAYAKRIETVGIKVPDVSYCLLRDIPAPERVLASEPITQSDKELVSFFFNSEHYAS